jgi:hypothetical protein
MMLARCDSAAWAMETKTHRPVATVNKNNPHETEKPRGFLAYIKSIAIAAR